MNVATTATGAEATTGATHEALLANRRQTIKWVTIGYCSFVVAMVAAWFLVPRLEPIAAPIDRLLLALQLTAGPGIVLFLIIQGLWRLMDTLEAENPLAGKESVGFTINQRVMTNTVEQALIFVPLYVAFAIRMEPEQVFWLPILMGIWCLGRIAFWIGYRIAPHYRAPGMDWTTGTAFVTLVLFVMTLF
jgi:hypothetical protein